MSLKLSPPGQEQTILAGVYDEGPDMVLSYDDMERVFDVKITDLLSPLLDRCEADSFYVETRTIKVRQAEEETQAQAEPQLLGTRTTELVTKGPGVDDDGLGAMSETPIGESVAEDKVSVMGEGDLSLLDGGLKGDPELMLNVVEKVVQDRDLSDLANGTYFVNGGLVYRRWVNTGGLAG